VEFKIKQQPNESNNNNFCGLKKKKGNKINRKKNKQINKMTLNIETNETRTKNRLMGQFGMAK
jgi:hypothetical protein